MRNPVQLGLLLLTLTAVAVFGYNVYLRETTPPARSYSDFLADLRAGEIVRVHLRGGKPLGANETPVQATPAELSLETLPGSSLQLIGDMVDQLASFDMVDLCPALLAIAHRRSSAHRTVNVVEADATTWRPTAAVDVILMSYSLTMMPDWTAVIRNAHAMLAPGGRIGIVDFHLPENTGRLGNLFWQRWFAHDGVHLSEQHLPLLRHTFKEYTCAECRADVPYLPVLRAPYFRFIGIRE